MTLELKGGNGIKKVMGGGESWVVPCIEKKLEGFIQWRKCLEK
jgi:hypothetical protein